MSDTPPKTPKPRLNPRPKRVPISARVTSTSTAAPIRPRKRGERSAFKRMRTDITLAPLYIRAIQIAAKRLHVAEFEWHRLAIIAYAKELLVNPIAPRPIECPACKRRFASARSQGEQKRLRIVVNFDQDTVELIAWIAENFYLGTWSHAFEAAAAHFLGGAAPPIALEARL